MNKQIIVTAISTTLIVGGISYFIFNNQIQKLQSEARIENDTQVQEEKTTEMVQTTAGSSEEKQEIESSDENIEIVKYKDGTEAPFYHWNISILDFEIPEGWWVYATTIQGMWDQLDICPESIQKPGSDTDFCIELAYSQSTDDPEQAVYNAQHLSKNRSESFKYSQSEITIGKNEFIYAYWYEYNLEEPVFEPDYYYHHINEDLLIRIHPGEKTSDEALEQLLGSIKPR